MSIAKLTLATAVMLVSLPGLASAQDANIVTLTQTPCQFLEPEKGDKGFRSSGKADCVAINEKTSKDRLATAKVINLKAGKTIFRVTNKNVSYPLGFYFRGSGIVNYATLPKVSGGGLGTGVTKDYAIDLKPGEYIFSCPLNSTPDYKVVVN